MTRICKHDTNGDGNCGRVTCPTCSAYVRAPELTPGKFIDIVFDGPPGPEAGRFIEVENDAGKSINVGTWIHRPDGMWALRITGVS